jgi:hypothetical protein
MLEAAEHGYTFIGVMGGETGFGGKEVVIVMRKKTARRAAPVLRDTSCWPPPAPALCREKSAGE